MILLAKAAEIGVRALNSRWLLRFARHQLPTLDTVVRSAINYLLFRKQQQLLT